MSGRKRLLTGLVAPFLVLGGILLGGWALLARSVFWGGLWLLGLLLLGFLLLGAFCSVCTTRHDCPHLWPGWVVQKVAWLRKRGKSIPPGGFSLPVGYGLLFVLLSLALAWEAGRGGVSLFLTATGIILMRLRLCPVCQNESCPLRKR